MPAETSAAVASPSTSDRRAVAYPELYCWLVLVSALDVIFTRIVLQFGGVEVNPVAQRAIDAAGHWGLIGLKFAVVALVVTICERIAATRRDVSQRLAVGAVAVSALPVLAAAVQLADHTVVVALGWGV